MKVYYAHCVSIYDTPQEARDIETLKACGFDVVNPNTPECDAGYKARGMEYFKKFAEECDAVAFRSLPDSSIPAGVAREIEMFRAEGKPVLELPSNNVRRVLSVEVTRQYLKEVGCR